jgi:alpha-L-fucosidase
MGNQMKHPPLAKVLNYSLLCIGVVVWTGVVMAQNKSYKPTWNSLRMHQTPQWFKDAKFGIYTHWGIYSVPAEGPNGTWYGYFMYREGKQYDYHLKHYGKPEEFGYKDFIPMFKAEKFNAEEWAELFQKAGAQFAGPVAEHHDGFAMWDTKYSEWNAAKMGPHRDVVSELERAIKKRGMKFVTTFHHDTHWWFFPTWDKRFDCADPRYAGLYGPIHEKGEAPTGEYNQNWKNKIIEVIDKYDPDLIWFDTGLGAIMDKVRREVMANYFNQALKGEKEVVVAFKDNDLPPGVGVVDLELAQKRELTYNDWMTDTSVDDQGAWSYVNNINYKSADRLIDNMIDIVSKNGCLLLSVGPKSDGSIPDEVKDCLLEIGEWLQVNGEAIYGTTAWTSYGEGPTNLKTDNNFNNEEELKYTGEDIRFTVKDDALYAICLDWPGIEVTIKSLTTYYPDEDYVGIYKSEIKSIKMLGVDKNLDWQMDEKGLVIKTPAERPCNYAYTFKITLN